MRRGDLTMLAGDYAAGDEPKGEIVIVLAPPPGQPVSNDDVDAMLRSALDRVSVKDAVVEVAAASGLPRRAVYQRALDLAKHK